MCAKDFNEIAGSVSSNPALQARIVSLIQSEKIPGKVTEGDGRVESLKEILKGYFQGQISLHQTISDVEFKIPRHYSEHENNNRVFQMDGPKN